jgi:nucleoside-diphosphate-sugar epimerase
VSDSAICWTDHHGDAFKACRILVTGGAGFIGSHLCEALVTLGADVVAIDDLSGGDWANLDGFGEDIEEITASILDTDAITRATRGCRYVFHEAALGSVPRSVEEPVRYHEVNVMGTVNVLQAAREAGVQRVVYAGSSSAYGDPPAEGAKVETMPPLPRSPYAATKLAAEHDMQAWAHSYGLDTAICRYFNIFGPRQNANSAYAAVIAAFAKALLQGGTPIIFGTGEQSRDFTFVHNAVHANLLAARCRKKLRGRVLNVACGGSVTVNMLCELMAEQLGRGDVKRDYQPMRAGDVMHSLADITRAELDIGYRPLVEFEAGLQQTVDWYRQALS